MLSVYDVQTKSLTRSSAISFVGDRFYRYRYRYRYRLDFSVVCGPFPCWLFFPFVFGEFFFLRRIPIAARASPRVPVEEGEEEGVGAATPLFSFLFPFRSQSTGDCPAVRSTPSTPRRLCLFVCLFACLFVGSFVGFGVAVGWLPSFAVAKSDGVPAVSLIFFFGAVWFFLFQVAYRPKLPEYRVLPNFFLRPKSASGVRVRVCLLGSFTEFKKNILFLLP